MILRFLTPALILLSAFAANGQTAETTYPVASGGTRSVSAVAPDNRHWTATLIGTGSGSTASNLRISRQPSDLTGSPWQTVADFTLESLPGYTLRFRSGKSTAWVAWQGIAITPASPQVFIRRVYPDIGPIESVTGTENQSHGFDLAIDDQERPCIVSFKANDGAAPNLTPNVRVHRRGSTGIWDWATVTAYQAGEEVNTESVAITASGNFLHVFDTDYALITISNITYRNSQLYHTEIEAPTGLAAAKIDSTFITAINSTSSEGYQPSIAHLSAATGPNGRPALAFSSLGSRQLKCAVYDGSSWDVETLTQPGGGITAQYLGESTIRILPDNRPVIIWRSSNTGGVTRSIRTQNVWSTKSVYEMQAYQPSFDFDRLGNAHYSGADFTTSGRTVALRPRDITDEDGNGFTHLEESAFLMTGLATPSSQAPRPGSVTISGETYPTLTYFRPIHSGGNTNPYNHPDFRYTVETSTDLVTWSSAGADLAHQETLTVAGQHTTATWRSTKPLSTHPRQFLRVRLDRIDN